MSCGPRLVAWARAARSHAPAGLGLRPRLRPRAARKRCEASRGLGRRAAWLWGDKRWEATRDKKARWRGPDVGPRLTGRHAHRAAPSRVPASASSPGRPPKRVRNAPWGPVRVADSDGRDSIFRLFSRARPWGRGSRALPFSLSAPAVPSPRHPGHDGAPPHCAPQLLSEASLVPETRRSGPPRRLRVSGDSVPVPAASLSPAASSAGRRLRPPGAQHVRRLALSTWNRGRTPPGTRPEGRPTTRPCSACPQTSARV